MITSVYHGSPEDDDAIEADTQAEKPRRGPLWLLIGAVILAGLLALSLILFACTSTPVRRGNLVLVEFELEINGKRTLYRTWEFENEETKAQGWGESK